MPTDYDDSDSFEAYFKMCMKLNALFLSADAEYIMVAGDFNRNSHSVF